MQQLPYAVLRLTLVTVELMVELVKQSASPEGEAEMGCQARKCYKPKERNKDCDKSSLSVPNAKRNARRVVAAG